MTETKFTPGPWQVGNEAEGESPLMVYCNDATGQRIADCANNLTFHSDEEKRANARLIAAAPEMFAFINEIAKFSPVFAKGFEKQRIKDAVAIIAKATAA